MRAFVLRRDLYRCRIVEGCAERASVADHIVSVFVGMPDALFFNPKNLRAGCRSHNLARGFAERLATDAGSDAEITGDYT